MKESLRRHHNVIYMAFTFMVWPFHTWLSISSFSSCHFLFIGPLVVLHPCWCVLFHDRSWCNSSWSWGLSLSTPLVHRSRSSSQHSFWHAHLHPSGQLVCSIGPRLSPSRPSIRLLSHIGIGFICPHSFGIYLIWLARITKRLWIGWLQFGSPPALFE